MSQVRPLATVGVALLALALSACDSNKPVASASPNTDSETADGLKETSVPGMGVSTNVVARTGTMSSGTRNSSTVAGAAPPGKTNPADAH